MQTQISNKGKIFSVQLGQPIDISIPLKSGKDNVNAFHIPPVKIEPFRIGSFVGDVNKGGSCNVNNIFFNPHGNGTHTECVGHISKENRTINECLKNFFFIAQLITIKPEEKNGDQIISQGQVSSAIKNSQPPSASLAESGFAIRNRLRRVSLKADSQFPTPESQLPTPDSQLPTPNSQLPTPDSQLPTPNSQLPTPDSLIIRTLPNGDDKINKHYSGTNPPYLHHEAARWICEQGIEHLLLDLPSVDREDDGGKLLAHHEFWQYPYKTRLNCTITELIYVPSSVPDGIYFLNLQIASFENDASPSKPLLFAIA